MEFRTATPEDAEALLAVYAEYIDTNITFEYALPSVEEFAGRIRGILEFYPYLVAEEEGRILGYAYAHRHMERAAYQWNAELSVYVAKEAVGRGLGTKLYRALLELLERQGVRSAFGCVTSPNPPSERLHLRLGFELVGMYKLAGWKNGQWHSVSWFQKFLRVHDLDPQPPVAFQKLPADFVAEVLERAAH